MNCPTCKRDMHQLGCTVENRPLHHCADCGTLQTCDGVLCVPDVVRRLGELGASVESSSTGQGERRTLRAFLARHHLGEIARTKE